MAGEIFISYRRTDEAWARLLHSQLRSQGVEAWFDAQIGAGEDWRKATAKALQASRIFVLLFSQAASDSDDIAKELAAATFSKKLIVPVRIENIQPTGAFLYELASRNWVNAFENTEAKLAELAQSLATLVKAGIADESIIPFDRNAHAKPQSRKWPYSPAIIFAAAVALIAIAAVGAWLLWPERHWAVESSRSFISTMALEGEPAFSPDGKMLAYTSGADLHSRKIYVRNVAGGNAIKITNDAYDDVSPPRLINSKYPRQFAPPITFRGDDVLIPDFDAAEGARVLSQKLAGGPDRILGYVPGAEAQDRFFESKMAVDPKAGDVIYVAAVQGDSNIDLLTLARH